MSWRMRCSRNLLLPVPVPPQTHTALSRSVREKRSRVVPPARRPKSRSLPGAVRIDHFNGKKQRWSKLNAWDWPSLPPTTDSEQTSVDLDDLTQPQGRDIFENPRKLARFPQACRDRQSRRQSSRDI